LWLQGITVPPAQTQVLNAMRLNPPHAAIRKRLGSVGLCSHSTRRGLSTAERHRRSLKLVELALDGMSRCIGTPSPDTAHDVADKAGPALRRRVSSARHEEVTGSDAPITNEQE
jgi:hypothetical protein